MSMPVYSDDEIAQGLHLRDPSERVMKVFGYIDDETGEFIPDKGRTKQEFAQDGDINHLIARITKTGTTDWLDKHNEWLQQTGVIDASTLDYKELMDLVADASSRFEQLPSEVRARFDNDPSKFLDFVKDEEGQITLGEMLGEIKKPIPEKTGSVAAAAAKAKPQVEQKQAAQPAASEGSSSSGEE